MTLADGKRAIYDRWNKTNGFVRHLPEGDTFSLPESYAALERDGRVELPDGSVVELTGPATREEI